MTKLIDVTISYLSITPHVYNSLKSGFQDHQQFLKAWPLFSILSNPERLTKRTSRYEFHFSTFWHIGHRYVSSPKACHTRWYRQVLSLCLNILLVHAEIHYLAFNNQAFKIVQCQDLQDHVANTYYNLEPFYHPHLDSI